jgi:predicted amidohydrolase YtcJ
VAAADLVITGAAVYRVDAARSWSDAVAVRGDRIAAVGSPAVRELVGPHTVRLHLPGALVLPGFQDAHIHAPFAGRNRRNVDLSELTGREAYLQHIADYAAAHPERDWIVGGGWAMEYFPGGTPRREELDAVVADRPVFLFNRDVHGAWVNSRALAIAGITKDSSDPADGRIERDAATGEPSGMLHEGAAYSFNDAIVPKPERAEWEAAILDAQQYLHSVGITGWQDAWVTPDTQAAYESLATAGKLTARVVGALWWDRHRGLEQIEDLVARGREATGNFLPRTVKIMVDGIIENNTAALLSTYCDGHGATGNPGLTYVPPEILIPAVVQLDSFGLQVHMHAIGDRAVRSALDAVQAARAANGHTDNRHHIAHLQLIHPEDIPRFRQLDVIANCQTYWAQHEPQMDEHTIPQLGPERARWQYPFGDLFRAGATLAMGSDWGVTTPDPLQQIEVAVRRVDPENRGNQPFLADQRLDLPVAVAAFTAGSAFVNHDDEAASINPGSRADLAVIDRNIFDPRNGLPADARVTHTIAAGKIVYGGEQLPPLRG